MGKVVAHFIVQQDITRNAGEVGNLEAKVQMFQCVGLSFMKGDLNPL